VLAAGIAFGPLALWGIGGRSATPARRETA
jgi:hypothetical protein